MKNLNQYICEAFVTLLEPDREKMLDYSHEVYDMIEKSYAYIGGLIGVRNYDEFVDECINKAKSDQLIWKLVVRGGTDKHRGKATAVCIYTQKRGGRKLQVMASDCTEKGINDLNMILKEDFKMKDRHAWEELSGKALGKALNIGKIVLPNICTYELLKDKWAQGRVQLLPDGFFFLRKFGDKWYPKAMVGNPPGMAPLELEPEMIAKLKQLSKEYEEKYEGEQ